MKHEQLNTLTLFMHHLHSTADKSLLRSSHHAMTREAYVNMVKLKSAIVV